jgi:protein phosphatase 1L
MKFVYGYGMLQGRSASIEDFLCAQIPRVNGQAIGMFGVFDGCNGFRAGFSEYVQDYLFLQHSKLVDDIKAMAETFQRSDQRILEHRVR